jgi:hypothetical protein
MASSERGSTSREEEADTLAADSGQRDWDDRRVIVPVGD